MPTVINSRDVKPIFIEKPDMRFATTFLSINNRDYSVIGESIMDKTTGEIFTKRLDGKVVSFFQNKKYNHDLCLELRILLATNADFYYDIDSTEGYFVNTDFDHMSLFTEKRGNILLHDALFPNVNPGEDEDEHNPGNINVTDVRFNVSNKSNGFFFRVTTRDSDKAFVEFLTTEYNNRFYNYNGPDELYATEAARFTNPKWYDSNAALVYTVEISKGSDYRVYTVTDYIRLNEKSCLELPMNRIRVDFPDGYDYALVTIKAVTYEKIQLMINHREELGEDFINNYNKFKPFDNVVPVDYYNVSYFADSVSDINLTDPMFVLAMLDIPYVRRYMDKVAALEDPGSVFVSANRPYDWRVNTLWCETVSDVDENGVYGRYKTEDYLQKIALRQYFDYVSAPLSNSDTPGVFFIDDNDPLSVKGKIQTNIDDTDDFYFGEGLPFNYTNDEIDHLLSVAGEDLRHRIENIVAIDRDSQADVDAASMVFDTVSTSESDD